MGFKPVSFFWRCPEELKKRAKREGENQIIVANAVNKSKVNPIIKNLKPVFLGKSGPDYLFNHASISLLACSLVRKSPLFDLIYCSSYCNLMVIRQAVNLRIIGAIIGKFINIH
jgi:hypothetical protein